MEQYQVTGMSCAACSARVEKAVSGVPGVTACSVSLLTNSMGVEVCVCNGRYYGGGFQPVPEAEPDDGKLELLLVDKVSRLKAASVIGKYKEGLYKELPELIRHYQARRIVIHCDEEEVVNLDGEARYGKDVEMRLAEEKLRFFYPKGLTYRKK